MGAEMYGRRREKGIRRASGIPNSLAAFALPTSFAGFTVCTLYSWSYLRAILSASAFPVTAKSKPAPTKLLLSREKIMLYTGESKKLFVEKTKPADAAVKVTWRTKNKKIADVSKYGKITAKKPGTTTITAVSKKNPSVTATVRVRVKKSPAKVEKECMVSGEIYDRANVIELEECYKRACSFSYKYSPDVIIVRSREGFDEIRKVWNNNRLDNLSFRKTEMAEYANMDFTKESLIFLTLWLEPEDQDLYQVTSITTKFDASGKLEGIINMQRKTPSIPSNIPSNEVELNDTTAFTLAFKIGKKEEAMIDYFRAMKIYDDFIIAP